MEWIAAYLALGSLVGFLAGLFGIGGGALMVPILTTLFMMQGFPAGQVVHLALATSMASIIATSISSLRAHHRHGAVIWPVVASLAPGVVAGTFGAALLASRASSSALAIFFTCFILYISVRMLFDLRPRPSRELPGSLGLMAAGGGIGSVSALAAIGGGSLTVPFLVWCNVTITRAVGTSAAVGLPIALAGTAGYLAGGWGAGGLPDWSLGYIYLPAVAAISLTSVLTAPAGAAFSHRLPLHTLRRLFALFLLALSIKMAVGVLAG